MTTLTGFYRPSRSRLSASGNRPAQHLTALLTALLMLLSANACSAQTLMILGDSLSSAYNVPLEEAWVSLLDQRLEREGLDWEVINESISGETTGGALRRLPGLLEELDPDAVVIELGGNDGLRGFPPEVIRNNLAQIIERSLNDGAEVLLVGMKMPPNYGSAYTAAFSQVFSDLAGRYDIPLVPFFLEGVYETPGAMQADGIHPTAGAQSRLLENLWPKLQTILQDTASD